jgi:DNA-binding transcriptional LysR family regulator
MPISFEALDATGLVAHPDALAYADDLLSLNFPAVFKGSEHLNVRTSINQIGQIPAPVCEGVGYTLLPRSGIDAYPDKARFRVAELPRKRGHELSLIMRRGRVLPARVRTLADLIKSISLEAAPGGDRSAFA